jgi:hypothetical protein
LRLSKDARCEARAHGGPIRSMCGSRGSGLEMIVEHMAAAAFCDNDEN